METEIELPEGKTLDDIHHCIGGGGLKSEVDIFLSGDDKSITRKPDIKIGENDFKEQCYFQNGVTTITDLDTNERVNFG